MALVDSLTQLAAADGAITTMRTALAAVDYAITVDASSTTTPQATRSARQALRGAIAQAIDTATAARTLVYNQAVAADSVVSGYADAIASVRAALGTGGDLADTTVDGVESDVVDALEDEFATVAWSDVQTAATAAEGAYAVDATAAVTANALQVDAKEALADAVADFRSQTAALSRLATNATAAADRLGTLLTLAQTALAAGKPWQAAVHLADARTVQTALKAAIDLGDPGYDATSATADPTAAWSPGANAVLTGITDWSPLLVSWANAENARIDAADRLARFTDERVVRLAEEIEDGVEAALTP